MNCGVQLGEQVQDRGWGGVWWGLPLGMIGLRNKARCLLLAGTPRNVGFEPVRDTLLSVPGVRATHELHLWSLTLTYHVASAHLAIGESTLAPASYFLETFLPSPPPPNTGRYPELLGLFKSVFLHLSLFHTHTRTRILEMGSPGQGVLGEVSPSLRKFREPVTLCEITSAYRPRDGAQLGKFRHLHSVGYHVTIKNDDYEDCMATRKNVYGIMLRKKLNIKLYLHYDSAIKNIYGDSQADKGFLSIFQMQEAIRDMQFGCQKYYTLWNI